MEIDLTGLAAKVMALEATLSKLQKAHPDLKLPTRDEFIKLENECLVKIKTELSAH